MKFPSIELKRNSGKVENILDYSGKSLLIVNVASNCGFTPQYKDLQILYDDTSELDFEILAFPCNQFGKQEPGSAEEIKNFCENNYKITFPIFEKTDVNGTNAHPLFDFLKTSAPGALGTTAIKWNFTKFLVDKNVSKIIRFAPQTSIIEIRKDLMPLLSE